MSGVTHPMCTAFATTGSCIMGDRCRFRHTGSKSAPPSPSNNGNNNNNNNNNHNNKNASHLSKITCRFYGLKTPCLNGSACPMMHSDAVAAVNRTTKCPAFKATGECLREASSGDCPFSHNNNEPQLCRQFFCYSKCEIKSCPFAHEMTPATASPAKSLHAAAVLSPPPLFAVMRHGARGDDAPPGTPTHAAKWSVCDPSLTSDGFDKARARAADFSAAVRASLALPSGRPVRVAMLVSPFLRCLQTARALMEGFAAADSSTTATATVRVADPIVVDPQMCEVFGPSVIKEAPADGPVLDADPSAVLGVAKERCVTVGALPRAFTETREQAHARMQARFRQILQLRQVGLRENVDVLLVVTHGDAVNASVLDLHPRRVVYSCEYLGCVFVANSNNSGRMEVQSALGVEWFDE